MSIFAPFYDKPRLTALSIGLLLVVGLLLVGGSLAVSGGGILSSGGRLGSGAEASPSPAPGDVTRPDDTDVVIDGAEGPDSQPDTTPPVSGTAFEYTCDDGAIRDHVMRAGDGTLARIAAA